VTQRCNTRITCWRLGCRA